MLAFYVALALYVKVLKRMPSADDLRLVRTVVCDIYRKQKRAQPKCLNKCLADLKAHQKVIEIIDVVGSSDKIEQISKPHSFVKFKDFRKMLKENKVLIAPGTGVFLSYDGEFAVVQGDRDMEHLSREQLQNMFTRQETSMSVVVF